MKYRLFFYLAGAFLLGGVFGWLLGGGWQGTAVFVVVVILLGSGVAFGRFWQTQTRQLQQAQTGLEAEKKRLAVLIAELAEGVLVCSRAGDILLYNHRATQLLQMADAATNRANHEVQLGGSVFALLDRNTITHALNHLMYQLEQQRTHPVSQFVTTATGGQLLKVRLIPVLTAQHTLDGFMVMLTNITQQDEASRRRDELLQMLTEGVRSSLANIRAAIETIEMFSEMDADKLAQLRHVIYDEALTLSTRLNQITRDHEAVLKANWHLEEMLAGDLLWVVQQHLSEQLGLQVAIDTQEDDLWLKVDSYAVVQAMTYIATQAKTQLGVSQVTLRLKRMGRLGAFDLAWPSDGVEIDKLWSWQREEFRVPGGELPLTLQEVAEHHGGEVWCQVDSAGETAYFRMLLPTTLS